MRFLCVSAGKIARLRMTGNIYAGLIYPMIFAAITFVIGWIFLRETQHTRIWDEFD